MVDILQVLLVILKNVSAVTRLNMVIRLVSARKLNNTKLKQTEIHEGIKEEHS